MNTSSRFVDPWATEASSAGFWLPWAIHPLCRNVKICCESPRIEPQHISFQVLCCPGRASTIECDICHEAHSCPHWSESVLVVCLAWCSLFGSIGRSLCPSIECPACRFVCAPPWFVPAGWTPRIYSSRVRRWPSWFASWGAPPGTALVVLWGRTLSLSFMINLWYLM